MGDTSRTNLATLREQHAYVGYKYEDPDCQKLFSISMNTKAIVAVMHQPKSEAYYAGSGPNTVTLYHNEGRTTTTLTFPKP